MKKTCAECNGLGCCECDEMLDIAERPWWFRIPERVLTIITIGAICYVVGAWRERVFFERELNRALKQNLACAARLGRAEQINLAVEPLFRAVWPRESAVWFGERKEEER